MAKIKVAVLMGGESAEREVSLATGKQVLNALDRDKYDVFALDATTGRNFEQDAQTGALPILTTGDGRRIASLTELPLLPPSERPDVVFIALHGPGGEDGTVQGFLETLGIAYTGSGVLASALAMDKVRCKALLSTQNIILPADVVFYKKDSQRNRRAAREVAHNLGFPVIVKPSRQGSTYGASVVKTEEGFDAALKAAFRYDNTVLVEQKLEGVEITVAVVGNDDAIPLPIVEIVPPNESGFFDYESKYSQDEATAAREIVPARISETDAQEARDIAVRCHTLLGCKGMSRTDMFVTEDGVYTLEVNTIPGMTQTSLLPKAAQAAGIPFAVLMDKLIEWAREK